MRIHVGTGYINPKSAFKVVCAFRGREEIAFLPVVSAGIADPFA
jgi:hypothetical protein